MPRRDAGCTNTSSAAPPPLAGAKAGCSDLVPLRGTPVRLTVLHPSCGDEARGTRVFQRLFPGVILDRLSFARVAQHNYERFSSRGGRSRAPTLTALQTGRLRWPTLVTAFIISLRIVYCAVVETGLLTRNK